jgi:hypothetical protein
MQIRRFFPATLALATCRCPFLNVPCEIAPDLVEDFDEFFGRLVVMAKLRAC